MTGNRTHLVPDLNSHRNLAPPGEPLANGTPVTRSHSLVEAGVITHYFKATCAGTLDFGWLRPDLVSIYDTLPVAQVAVTANTEKVTVIPCTGQAGLRIIFTPGANGVVTTWDVAARSGGYTAP